MHKAVPTALIIAIIAFAGCAEEVPDTPTQDTDDTDIDGNATIQLPLNASLEADATNGTAPLVVVFTIDGSGDNATWSLDFGDGNSTEGDAFPATVNHTYGPGNMTAILTVSAAGNSTEATLDIDVDEAAREAAPRELPETLHFEYAESLGCAGDALQAGGADCISALEGPDASGIDGFWQELSSLYWGLGVTTTVDNGLGDSDCYFTDADFGFIEAANNSSGPCQGVVPEGTAWVFLYSYAEPATGQTMTFSA